MLETIKELYRYRELLKEFVKRELLVRYKGSIFGILWSLMTPLLSVAVMTFVVGHVMNLKAPSMSAYILAAYLPFTFFNVGLMDSSQSVLSNLNVMKKVYVPHEIFPLAVVISNAIHLILAFGVLVFYMAFTWARTGFHQSPFTWHIVFLPLVFAANIILMCGLSLIISALNVFYEDVKHILGILLWILFFMSPVMYFDESVYYSALDSGSLLTYKLYNLNPLAILCTDYRHVFIAADRIPINRNGHQELVQVIDFSWPHYFYLLGLSLALLAFGFWLFERLKWKFVERA